MLARQGSPLPSDQKKMPSPDYQTIRSSFLIFVLHTVHVRTRKLGPRDLEGRHPKCHVVVLFENKYIIPKCHRSLVSVVFTGALGRARPFPLTE